MKQKKHVILFLAANPRGTDALALDREARAIHHELKRSGYRDRFEFVTRWATEPLDLLRELRDLKPTVVHFSGHGTAAVPGASWSATMRDVVVPTASDDEPQGLILHDAAGDARIVSRDALAPAFEAAGASVKLVVLNACFTEPIAEALLAHVNCVVGMSGAIHDDAARIFATGFYGALGEHESVAAAYEHGKAAIHIEAHPDVARPRLHVRHGVDATAIILAAVAPVLRQELPCPYPGMRPYTADDAAGFHGRDDEINELLDRFRFGDREIYVIGPSGCGKSSLVTAGVLPRLARGVAGMNRFVVRVLRPGEQPATRLAEALDALPGQTWVAADRITALLAHRAPGSSVLLLIDQLEELFTVASAQEREQFLDVLSKLRAEPRCCMIFTLRADFFGALMESPLWAECKRKLPRIEVSPLRGELLRDAIAEPARTVGVTVEQGLIEKLVADAASEPGILPLLQETMVRLWDVRKEQTLTLADYQALGDSERSGLAVTLARQADVTLGRLTATQDEIARRIFLRLISFGEGRSDTRRQQPRSKLRADSDGAEDFAHVLQQLIGDRLFTIVDDDDQRGDPLIDLGHEILIAAWPTLAGWLESHRADEQRRRQLEEAAAQHHRGERGLLDSIELAEAEKWQRTESARELGQSADVAAFVAASRAAHDKQRRRRRGLLAGAFVVLAGFGVVVAVLAIAERDQANNAHEQANNALAQANIAREQTARAEASDRESKLQLAKLFEELGRQELVEKDHPQEAIPYFLEARRNGLDTVPLRMMFRAASRQLPRLPAFAHQDQVMSAAFSPDGTRVVTASWDKTARVWDTATGQPLTNPLAHQDRVWSAAFSPDGTRVVTASLDKTARVWDAVTGQPLTNPLAHQKAVMSAAFSPDGTRVVTASLDKTARVWDTATGQPLTTPLAHQEAVMSAAFSPDGTRVVTASLDKTARVWDAATGQPLTRPLAHQDQVVSAAFSPDGTRVVTASYDKTARVWDTATGQPLTNPLAHQEVVRSAAFSPDGTRVVTASVDKTARVWDAATGQPLTRPLAHQGQVWSAAFSPDGTRVVTASLDQTARVWDAVTGQPVARPLAHQGYVVSATFSPDGTRVVTASYDKTARVWDTATGQPLTNPLAHQGKVVSAAFSPDGTRVVTASWDKTARMWNAATGQPLTRPLEHQDQVLSAAFSPDGTRVVTASVDQTARVWDAATGQPLTHPLAHQGIVVSATFSPDGTRVVTVSLDQTARVWDAVTGQPVTGPLAHPGQVVSARFSSDGTCVVTASEDKTARVWDAATGQPVTSPLAHQGSVVSAAFSPDGTHVVTASEDKTARVWDVRPDTETVTDWATIAERSPFVLNGVALVPRPPPSYLAPADAFATKEVPRPTSPSVAPSPDERPAAPRSQLP